MKTKSIITLSVIIILTLVVLGSCNPQSDNGDDGNSNIVCTDTIGRITRAAAIVQQDFYVQNLHRTRLQSAVGVPYEDNREFWFDLDELKCYIEYVERFGSDNGYNNLGMRVYLGAKDEGDGRIRTQAFFYGTGRFAGAGGFTQSGPGIVEPNLPGIDALNKSASGLPPNNLNRP